ncbi:50S ribosomal protein L28 [Patescibacteria group bacterium]|nr:50S ribosomal protein L28 [Patescibacteria group bacterium]
MLVCEICGKGAQYGHNIRHTHTGQWEKRASKTRRIFLPNIQKGKVFLNGKIQNVRACASCLAKYKVKYAPAHA